MIYSKFAIKTFCDVDGWYKYKDHISHADAKKHNACCRYDMKSFKKQQMMFPKGSKINDKMIRHITADHMLLIM